MEDNKIQHPKHYNREGAMECFDEFMLIYGKEAAIHACLFNIHKYRYRAADKNGQEDLKKSDWYMKKYKELCADKVSSLTINNWSSNAIITPVNTPTQPPIITCDTVTCKNDHGQF